MIISEVIRNKRNFIAWPITAHVKSFDQMLANIVKKYPINYKQFTINSTKNSEKHRKRLIQTTYTAEYNDKSRWELLSFKSQAEGRRKKEIDEAVFCWI